MAPLHFLGCGKRPATASMGGRGGELLLVAGSTGRAGVSQVLGPAGLEGSVLATADSQMRVIFGNGTPGVFLHSPVLSFLPKINLLVLSMTNMSRYFCRAGPGRQQTSQ